MRPVIGLSTYREPARWGVWDVAADLLPAAYAQAVEAAGGLPVLLPAVDDLGAAMTVVDRIDALVISGGADVSPDAYGADPHQQTRGWRDDRDAWEIALLDAADARDIPVLGICRGMQVMAVRAGGELEQHLPDVVEHERHSPGGDEYGVVDVLMESGTALAKTLGERVEAHCHHHQSVRSHPGYTPAAYAADGTLEAMEDPERPLWWAVQWHPETQRDMRLFEALVAAADDH